LEELAAKLSMSRKPREAGGVLVLRDVAALEPSRPEHRGEPAGNATRQRNGAADPAKASFQARARSAIETAKHPTDGLPMLQLLALDRLNFGDFFRPTQRTPVTTIGHRGGELTRMCPT